jgi:putative restriction endonuclease
LRASHIKPWCKSDDREKLDGYNGLLLAPHVDLLFDRGWISFSDDGKLLVSDKLDRTVLTAWGIPENLNVGGFRPEQCKYLAWHRETFGFGARARRRAGARRSTVDG